MLVVFKAVVVFVGMTYQFVNMLFQSNGSLFDYSFVFVYIDSIYFKLFLLLLELWLMD